MKSQKFVDGWMICNCTSFSFLVIPGQCLGDNERLCAMEPCLWLERFLPQAGLKRKTTRSVC